jgi:hypothetical protein
MRKFLLIIILLFGFGVYGQDVSGATSGAISTTTHTKKVKSRKIVKKPVKVLYVFDEDIMVPNTFILFKGNQYPVYKNSKGRTYFVYNKRKIFFNKK